jgi:hypothetical protein
MGCRAPQAPSTGTRLGVPARSLGVVTQEVRLPAVPSLPCRCPRPASGVQCPRVPVHATGVQCPVRASERPGVRCPASGVRAFRRPLCPAEVRSWSAAVGQAAARLGWPGSAWSPAASTTGSWSARVGAWRSKLAQAAVRQWGVGLDLAVVVGGDWAVARSTTWPTRIGRGRLRIVRR